MGLFERGIEKDGVWPSVNLLGQFDLSTEEVEIFLGGFKSRVISVSGGGAKQGCSLSPVIQYNH